MHQRNTTVSVYFIGNYYSLVLVLTFDNDISRLRESDSFLFHIQQNNCSIFRIVKIEKKNMLFKNWFELKLGNVVIFQIKCSSSINENV